MVKVAMTFQLCAYYVNPRRSQGQAFVEISLTKKLANCIAIASSIIELLKFQI